jgi:hypothetical protein
MDHQLIRSDDEIEDAASEGFGAPPQLVPPRPDAALTTLVTGVALAICIVVTATAVAFGRAQNSHAAGPTAERSVAIAAQPLQSRS